MMPVDPERELEALNKRMVFLQVVDAPGMILIGLGLFGKFGGNPAGLHPMLANANVTTVMITAGGVIAGWCLIELIKTLRRRAELLQYMNQ